MFKYALLVLCCLAARAWCSDSERPFIPIYQTESAFNTTPAHLRLEMTAELVLMAVGKHTYFINSLLRPQSYDEVHVAEVLDQQQHIVAMTIVQLMLQLHTMERMDKLLNQTVHEVIASAKGADSYPTLMNTFYQEFQSKMDNETTSDSLREEFARTKVDMASKFESLPKTRRRVSSWSAPRSLSSFRTLMWKLEEADEDVRKVVVATLFLDERTSNTVRHRSTVNGLLNLSNKPDLQKEVERIFRNATDEFVQEQTLVHSLNMESFFTKLIAKLRADEILNSEAMQAGL